MSESLRTGSYMRANWQGQTRNATLRPRFYIETVRDESGTFRDEERVEIVIPGNQFTRPVKIVTDEHRQRWPAEYAAFKNQTTVATTGFPIEHWPALSRAQVQMLKYHEVHTVEDCARLDDQALQRIGMGARSIKNAAAAYLDDAVGAKLTSDLARANELKDSQIAALTDQVKQLGEMMERMQRDLLARAQVPSAVDTFVPGMPGFSTPVPAPEPVSPLAAFVEPKRRQRTAEEAAA